MRIISDDVWEKDYADLEKETIEITDDEWNLIEKAWHYEAREIETYQYCFSRYLKELLRLKQCQN